MTRLLLAAMILCTTLAVGCGGDKDKGANRDKDRQTVKDKNKG
jgi:hypothetical protein